jgi:hypothetical protein
MALAAGLDTASLPRTPARRAVERVAGLLPIPGFLRSRMYGGSEQLVPVSEPMAAAWSKAVAAGAALLVAGVGAGVGPHGGAGPVKPAPVKPAAAHARAAAPRTSHVQRAVRVAPRHTAKVKATSHTGGRRSSSPGRSQRTAAPRSAGAPRSASPAGGQPRQTAASKPAAVNPTGSAPAPSRGVHAPSSGGGGPEVPSLPSVTLPSAGQGTGTTQVGGQVDQAVQDAGDAVQQTTDAVGDAVNGVTGSLPTP